MPHVHLSSTKGGEALLLDDASVPGKLVHECPAGQTNGDLVYLSIINLSTATRSLFFALQGTDIPVPVNRDSMDRVDCPSSPTGIDRLVGSPFVVAPGFKFHMSADTLSGEAPLAVYGYVERATTGATATQAIGRLGLRIANTASLDDDYPLWPMPIIGNEHAFAFARAMDLPATAMLQLYLDASEDLGPFTPTDATFQIQDIPASANVGALHGKPDDLTLGIGHDVIWNYPNVIDLGAFAGNVVTGSGMIIIPAQGLYHIGGWIHGTLT